MELVRDSSFEEFVRWYLARERRKRGVVDPILSGRSWSSLLTEMRGVHPDKLRSWFEGARWSIVSLCSLGEAMSLVCVDGPQMRRIGLVKDSGADNRLSQTIVAAARAIDYFDNEAVQRSNAVEAHYRQDRIEEFRRNWPQLRGDERLALCSLNEDEKRENPGGTYYLHDGYGRLVPWLYAILYEGREYLRIEAFLAEEN